MAAIERSVEADELLVALFQADEEAIERCEAREVTGVLGPRLHARVVFGSCTTPGSKAYDAILTLLESPAVSIHGSELLLQVRWIAIVARIGHTDKHADLGR